MLTGRSILCFANDWGADPTSKHHLMRLFAEDNDVLWVESAGMRTPNLASTRDLQRIVSKLGTLARTARHVLPRLRTYSPPSIPLPTSRLAARINKTLCQWSVQRELRKAGVARPPLIYTFVPHVAPWIRDIPRAGLVYHCVDRWDAFQEYDRDVMVERERELCSAADLVLASAEDLADRCRQHAARTFYVPHGVDHGHFAAALEPGPVPADLAGIPEPRVGFFGLLHEWVDLELIARLADALPCSFVLIGAAHVDLSPLAGRSNIHHLGRRPFGDLPSYCRGFQAAIVPFHVSPLTASVNPIKLREYAAAGLPVVSTDLPEVRKCRDIATCASGDAAWIAALRDAVARGADTGERRRQSERVRPHDWRFVHRHICTLIEESEVSAASAS